MSFPTPLVRSPGSRVALVLAAFTLCVIALQTACEHSVDDNGADDGPNIFGTDASAIDPRYCIQTECPKPFASCGDGLCTTNLTDDVDHCGACDNPCPVHPTNGSSICTGGKCKIACHELTADCNGLIADGCETPTDKDPLNCGGCGITCNDSDAGTDAAVMAAAGDSGAGTGLCWRGACGCPNGFSQCGDECKQLQSDSQNCGACGNVCKAPTNVNDPAWICGPGAAPANTKWLCSTGECTLQCEPGFGDCNKQFCADGCEVSLAADPNNCGACGNKCNANQLCIDGACLCPEGTTACDGQCVDFGSDTENCGGCGIVCPGPSGHTPRRGTGGGPACNGGNCTYICFPGFADCDGDLDNGCEVNLTNDPRHCGSCKTPCPLGPNQPCVTGKCLTRDCDAGAVH